ncbi:MAG: hypothetical protein L0170_19430 [Acidobacteria bacterium]|nr:hypothetical protein [Acidobacteriota bacterium]
MTDEQAELEIAESYAVAAIIYYGDSGRCPGLSDAEFDGRADWLLQRKAWKRFPYLEQSMLAAGSGYDLEKFPRHLHARAATQLAGPCPCLRCMAQRGEIKDPEVLQRLGVTRG